MKTYLNTKFLVCFINKATKLKLHYLVIKAVVQMKVQIKKINSNVHNNIIERNLFI